MTADDIITAARAWIGTRWQHQGRTRGAGVDCVGLIVGALGDVGITVEDRAGYGRVPDGSLIADLDRQLMRVDEPEHGGVALFALDGSPMHVSWIADSPSGWRMIHAYAPSRRVVEHGLDDRWLARLVRWYHVPGVV